MYIQKLPPAVFSGVGIEVGWVYVQVKTSPAIF